MYELHHLSIFSVFLHTLLTDSTIRNILQRGDLNLNGKANKRVQEN